MDARFALSTATWRAVDRDAGRLPDPQAAKLRFLLPAFLAAVTVLGASGLVELNIQPPSRPAPVPVLPVTDGLPAVMVAGQRYETTLRVTFPADWRGIDGTTHALVIATGRGKPPDAAGTAEFEIYYCSAGAWPAAGQAITVGCRLDAPSPGPFELHLSAGDCGFELPIDNLPPDHTVTKNYAHTVVPAAQG